MELFSKYLYRVDLDLTGLCNRTCYFCPRTYKSYPNVNEHMSMETLDIVLGELWAAKFTGVIELAGRGEPTLHPEFEKIVDKLMNGPWTVRVTTNGYKIEKYWDTVYTKIDELILNTYSNQEEFEERLEKYVVLPSGERVDHYFKPDTLSIEEINNLGPQIDYKKGGKFTYLFNNRAGSFSDKGIDAPCWHPMRQIFIDYHGNYQMCCNDWKYQIKIGNVHERSLKEMYENDPKLQRIRWSLINGRRQDILPCKMCDDKQGTRPDTARLIRNLKETNEYKFGICKTAGQVSEEIKHELRGYDLIPIYEEDGYNLQKY